MLSIGINLRVTGHCNQGGRKYMEDMFSVAYQQSSGDRDLEYAFFGIFDGHGGGEAAAFAKEHLMDIIVKQKNFWSDKDEDVLRAIRDGYVNTHYAMWRELDKWPRTASGLPSTAGTTASIAFIRKGKIYIGHVGDSGIILGYQEEGDTQWKAKALTKDHKPESVPEMTRIQESGGKVVSKSGVPRVVWNRPRIGHKGPVRRSTHIDEIPFLAVARALGDLWSYNSELDTFVVSPEPDVKVVTIDVKTHRCLIFGTDGLWNMLTPQAAVAIVQAAERQNEKNLITAHKNGGGQNDVQMWINPSTSLVDRALERWSSTRLRADNTSVVTLMLDPPGPSRNEVFQNQKREHVESYEAPVRPVFYPTNSVNQADAIRKSNANSEILDPTKSPLKPCLSYENAEKAVSSVANLNQTSYMERIQNTPYIKSLKTEDSPLTVKSIQVAEVSSSGRSESAVLQNPLDFIRPISGFISSENDFPPLDSISNLENLIEKVPKPERFSVETKIPNVYSDEQVESLFAMSRQKPFCSQKIQDQEGFRTKRVSTPNSGLVGEEKFQGLTRHSATYDKHKEIQGQFSQRPKGSNNLESVADEKDKLHLLTRQKSFCEKSQGVPVQFGSRQKKSNALDSITDDIKSGIQYTRPIILNESKRKQLLILHSEKPNLYINENLNKTGRRHSIATIPRNTLTSKSTLTTKESSVPFLGCRIKRDSKSLPGNIFEEPKIADSTIPRINNSLRGVKRRHSSITHSNDGVCIIGETCAKRRTRSEDRPNPIDENDPANEKLAVKEAQNRLRWPANDSSLSRSGGVVNSSVPGIQERRLASPNSFQRRNLEKKVTPVKTIRRPSINGSKSNRIQLRGIFGLRDWDQNRSSRNLVCASRHRTVVGLSNAVKESTTPQRWLRSDTIAATPVKTLRSRNVDIAGHTVSAQVAHQYPIKQSRLPLPVKLKATSTSILTSTSPAAQPSKNKTSCSSTSSSTGKVRQSKCTTTNGISESCSNVITIAGIANDSTLSKRVKSPHSLASRVPSVSPHSTRSRIKRLGK